MVNISRRPDGDRIFWQMFPCNTYLVHTEFLLAIDYAPGELYLWRAKNFFPDFSTW